MAAPDATILFLAGAAGNVPAVLIRIAALVAIVLVGATIILWVRRRLFAPQKPVGPGMSMEQLRRLRDRGELSPEEYDSLRLAVVQQASGNAAPGGGGVRPGAAPGGGRESVAGAGEAGSEGGVRDGWDVRSEPGYDLTGRPLPGEEGAAESPENGEGPSRT